MTTHEITARYDFATMGGVQGTISLLATVPNRAVIVDGMVDVIIAPTSAGAAQIALQVEGAGDLIASAVLASWGLGRQNIIPVGTAASSVKTTADRVVSIVVTVADLTAGELGLNLGDVRTCCRKVRYGTELEARQAAERGSRERGKPLWVYKSACDVCDGWHLTSHP